MDWEGNTEMVSDPGRGKDDIKMDDRDDGSDSDVC